MTAAPLLEPASSRQIVVFNNSLTAGGSPWRQGPNEKVDLMWESIIHGMLDQKNGDGWTNRVSKRV
jgi:hypothetical protein